MSEGFLQGDVDGVPDQVEEQRSASAPQRFSRTQRVGLFSVDEFSQFGGEMRFLTSSCGLVDACGLVFSPGGRPPNRGEDSFTHLYGSWWHWYQSW